MVLTLKVRAVLELEGFYSSRKTAKTNSTGRVLHANQPNVSKEIFFFLINMFPKR